MEADVTRTGRQLDSPTGPRIAFVGTYPPRRCGIATFTEDLRIAVDSPTSWVAAMEDDPGARSYPPEVRLVIDQHDPQAYAEAAEQLSREADIVCLQECSARAFVQVVDVSHSCCLPSHPEHGS